MQPHHDVHLHASSARALKISDVHQYFYILRAYEMDILQMILTVAVLLSSDAFLKLAIREELQWLNPLKGGLEDHLFPKLSPNLVVEGFKKVHLAISIWIFLFGSWIKREIIWSPESLPERSQPQHIWEHKLSMRSSIHVHVILRLETVQSTDVVPQEEEKRKPRSEVIQYTREQLEAFQEVWKKPKNRGKKFTTGKSKQVWSFLGCASKQARP